MRFFTKGNGQETGDGAYSARDKSERSVAIDALRALCSIAVVLMHVGVWFNRELGVHTVWDGVSVWLSPIRMPVFFFISGVLAWRITLQSRVTIEKKVIGIYAIYVIWTGIFYSRLFLPGSRWGMERPGLADFLLALFIPTNFWFIWALPVFTVVSYLMGKHFRMNAWKMLAPAVVLALLTPAIANITRNLLPVSMGEVQLAMSAYHYVWFVAGMIAGSHYIAFSQTGGSHLVFATVVFFAVVCTIPSERWSIGATAVIAGTFLWASTQILDRCRAYAPFRFLAHLGKGTLAIYIFHLLLLPGLSVLVRFGGFRVASVSPSWLVLIVGPVVLTAVLVGVSHYAGSLLENSRLRFLIVPSAWSLKISVSWQTLRAQLPFLGRKAR